MRRNYTAVESPCFRASVPRGEASTHNPANRQSFLARHKGLGGSAERWRSDSQWHGKSGSTRGTEDSSHGVGFDLYRHGNGTGRNDRRDFSAAGTEIP